MDNNLKRQIQRQKEAELRAKKRVALIQRKADAIQKAEELRNIQRKMNARILNISRGQ
jgi:predicted HTH domain antitoxin